MLCLFSSTCRIKVCPRIPTQAASLSHKSPASLSSCNREQCASDAQRQSCPRRRGAAATPIEAAFPMHQRSSSLRIDTTALHWCRVADRNESAALMANHEYTRCPSPLSPVQPKHSFIIRQPIQTLVHCMQIPFITSIKTPSLHPKSLRSSNSLVQYSPARRVRHIHTHLSPPFAHLKHPPSSPYPLQPILALTLHPACVVNSVIKGAGNVTACSRSPSQPVVCNLPPGARRERLAESIGPATGH
jgi:hypothetical protein